MVWIDITVTIAVEVSAIKISTYKNAQPVLSTVTLISSSFVCSQGVSVISQTRVNSQSWFSYTPSQSLFDISSASSSSLAVYGVPLLGVADSFGIIDFLSSSISGSSFLGVADSNGSFYEITDNRNTNPISSTNPQSLQDVVLVDWNFFAPLPQDVIINLSTKPRDATRFQKAYSFSRGQPVRIRVFR